MTKPDWRPPTLPLWIGATQFYTSYGSPSAGFIDASGEGTPVWWLDAAAVAEVVCSTVQYRGAYSGSAIRVDILYAMTSATSGKVYVGSFVKLLSSGDDLTVAGDVQYVNPTVPGTANCLGVATATHTVAYVTDELIRVSVARYGSNGNDDATGDMGLIGVTVWFK